MNERVIELLRKPWVVPTSVGVASFVVGAGAGYIFARRQYHMLLQEAEEAIADFNNSSDEITSLTNELKAITKGLKEDTESFLSEVKPKREVVEMEHRDVVMNPRPNPKDIVVVPPPDDEETPEVINIFNNKDDDWNYEIEQSTRTKERPYTIHADEYFGEEMGFGQSTLTYYEGDEILCDENDVPMYKYPDIVGELKFGHGSGDPNVVYVRNEKLHAEWEILRDKGKYEIEVLGHQVEREMDQEELKHSRHVGKFRPE